MLAERHRPDPASQFIIADLVTTAGLLYLALLFGSLCLYAWFPLVNRINLLRPTGAWSGTEPLTVLPTLLLSGVAGAFVVRLARGPRPIPYAILLSIAFAALARPSIFSPWPQVRSMLMAGRIFIVAGYLVLPVVGAILSRRRGHEGIGGGA